MYNDDDGAKDICLLAEWFLDHWIYQGQFIAGGIHKGDRGREEFRKGWLFLNVSER